MTDFKAINRAAFEWMTEQWNAGMTVCITNHLRSVQITPKRREAVRINASGDLQIQAGKRWDTIIFSGVKVAAFEDWAEAKRAYKSSEMQAVLQHAESIATESNHKEN